MSVLRCAICEENRDVLTKVVEDVIKTLGTFVQGNCPTLTKPVCSNCESTHKNFDLFIRDVKINVVSDEEGNYVAKLDPTSNFTFYNSLAIINSVKTMLNEAAYTTDVFEHAFIQNYRLACKCGHKKFH